MRIMNDQDTFAFENREYVSPTVSRDEQLGFIDNLRDVRNKNVERINADTYNLGTQVPSIRGGLGGSNATFESRYITPYVNSTIQGLKTAAQQTALTQALENLQAQYKQRYNEAYKAAQKRAAANNGNGSTETPPIGLEIEDDTNQTQTYLTNDIPGTIVSDTGANVQWTSLSDGSLVKKENYPTMSKTYHPSWEQAQDLLSRYSKRELDAIAEETKMSKSTNANNGFYVNSDGKIIGFGHDIDRSSGQFVSLDKGL